MTLQEHQKRRRDRQKCYGLYRGRVEENHDPKGLGRVKVRIPHLHGVPVDEARVEVRNNASQYIPSEHLPWARVLARMPTGSDFGSFDVYHVGVPVIIAFEGGDVSRPLVLGSLTGSYSRKAKKMGQFSNKYPNKDTGSWRAIGPYERPLEAMPDEDNEYHRTSIFKSVKGHTLYYDEENEKESMSLIDRAGQIFRFIAPVKDEFNRTGNKAFQRGIRNAMDSDDGGAFPYTKIKERAVLSLRDLAGQVLKMVSEQFKERIELFSVSKDEYRKTKRKSGIKLDSGEGKTGGMVIAQDDDLGNVVYIEANATDLTFDVVLVQNGTEVSRFNMNGGKIRMDASDEVKTAAPSIETSDDPSLGENDTKWVDEREDKLDLNFHAEYADWNEADVDWDAIWDELFGSD